MVKGGGLVGIMINLRIWIQVSRFAYCSKDFYYFEYYKPHENQLLSPESCHPIIALKKGTIYAASSRVTDCLNSDPLIDL